MVHKCHVCNRHIDSRNSNDVENTMCKKCIYICEDDIEFTYRLQDTSLKNLTRYSTKKIINGKSIKIISFLRKDVEQLVIEKYRHVKFKKSSDIIKYTKDFLNHELAELEDDIYLEFKKLQKIIYINRMFAKYGIVADDVDEAHQLCDKALKSWMDDYDGDNEKKYIEDHIYNLVEDGLDIGRREQLLKLKFKKRGLTIRLDSKVCSLFIEGGFKKLYDMNIRQFKNVDDIVNSAEEMDFLHKYTKYGSMVSNGFSELDFANSDDDSETKFYKREDNANEIPGIVENNKPLAIEKFLKENKSNRKLVPKFLLKQYDL